MGRAITALWLTAFFLLSDLFIDNIKTKTEVLSTDYTLLKGGGYVIIFSVIFEELCMKITKSNLTIRSATPEDAEILTSWWNDGKVMAHAGFPLGLNMTAEETLKHINDNETSISQRCIIEIDGERVGEMNFRIYEDRKAAEMGIKICNFDYQNRGYGTRLIKMLIEFLFSDEKINAYCPVEKIILDTNVNNKRAQRVYEKIGFTNLGISKTHWYDQLGAPQYSINYELPRQYYEKARKEDKW